MRVRFTSFDEFYTVVDVLENGARIKWNSHKWAYLGFIAFENFPHILDSNKYVVENLPQSYLKALKCYLQEE